MMDVAFSCSCGEISGTVHKVAPNKGNHVRCFCASCRAGAVYCGAADPGDKGVTLFQTTPDKVTFDRGHDKLAVFSFGPRNLLRWRAGCCGDALFTSLRNPKFALLAIMTNRLQNTTAIGPVKSQAFVPTANGKHRHDGALAIFGGTGWRALKAFVTGRWKQTPLFDAETLEPVAKPVVVSKSDRKALLA